MRKWIEKLTAEEREYLELEERLSGNNILDVYDSLKDLKSDFDMLDCKNHIFKLKYCLENMKDYGFYLRWQNVEELLEEDVTADEVSFLEQFSHVDLNLMILSEPHELSRLRDLFESALEQFREPFVEFYDRLEFGKDKNCETVQGLIDDNGDIFNKIVDKAFNDYKLRKSTMFKVRGTEAIYNLRTHRLKVHGYFIFSGSYDSLDISVRLSKEQRDFVVNALEKYCQETYNCSCIEKLNKIRKRKKLVPLNGTVTKGLDKIIGDAEGQKHCRANHASSFVREER